MNRAYIPIILAILAACTAANGQTRAEAWADLKSLQEKERTSLHNRQGSELNLLISIQKAALARFAKTRTERRAILKEQAAEREKLSKRHAAERSEMTKIHAAERSAFLNPTPAKVLRT